ncbi:MULTISPECIES: EutN/CcmL family microcompartment protein [unclassified Paenibacillus]|uniref:EutN/CcmL family microcompartment protein n=1 Tax=unclassified Paenibacillus TaxID=185978 RepID=UPI001C11560E|nr:MULTISPECIES: EutN/CcmL family microcompartment protein [unclassified Paenibacillus]MBU5441261.1 EutN/CcmL family microcompartment protein [Paenibacillus sp. MSJ-34]
MKLGRVLGNIVATVKTGSHHGCKLMVVEPVDERGNSCGDPFIAVDCSHAGEGDLVLVVEEGGSAREAMKRPDAAVDAVIVGVVDRFDDASRPTLE